MCSNFEEETRLEFCMLETICVWKSLLFSALLLGMTSSILCIG